MSIPFNSRCLLCHLGKAMKTAEAHGDEATAMDFARELMEEYRKAPADVGSPWFAPATADLLHKYYGLDIDRFRQEKLDSNAFAMARLEQIRARVEAAEDPVYAGLQYAVLGNYIDFSALHGEVSLEKLDEMLPLGEKIELDRECYRKLREDLAAGSSLLYITDNAGEIVFDRICAEQIHKAFPNVAITFCVRGGPANNDATREDAAAVGISFPVIDNGNRIPGTQIEQLSDQARQAFESAHVILAKGQGNVETLFGCGRNIYYAFLVKCILFMEKFQKPKLTPMLLRERDVTCK